MSIRRVIYTVALLLCGAALPGQNLPSEMEFMPGTERAGSVSAGADLTGGSLRLAQEAARRTRLYLDAAGESQVGRFHMKGSFRFTQSYEDGVNFASTFNPLRPMPYVIADSTGGDWKKQDYLMGVDISMPLIAERVALGLQLGLEAGRGAKNTDPRPQAGICDIRVMPSLTFNAGAAGIFSAALGYSLYRETSNLILYDSSQPQKLYLLKGLGQYTSEVFSNSQRERKYGGNTLEAQAAWALSRGDLRYRLSASYQNGSELVFDIDNSKPHDRGRYITHEYGGAASLAVDKLSWGGEAILGYKGYKGSGREIVQHFESSSDVNAWVTDSENPARYLRGQNDLSLELKAWLKDSQERKSWYMGLVTDYTELVQEYKATSSYRLQNLLYMRPYVGHNSYFSASVLDLSIAGIFPEQLKSELDYAVRESDDSTIAEGLIYHDFLLPLRCYGASASAGWSKPLKNARTLALKAQASYVTGGRLNRFCAGLSLAYSF